MKRLCVQVLLAHCLVLGLLFMFGCDQEAPQQVSLANRAPLPVMQMSSKETALNLCIGAMVTPKHGYVYYQQLVEYLALQLDMEINVIDPGTYRQVNALLENGKVDVAFVCSGPYVEGHERFGLTLLAAPVVNGEAAYYSNLIVPSDSPVQTLADLKGRSFAFTDPESNSGALVPLHQLAALGTTAEAFFSSFIFTRSHDRSIHAVKERLVEGAAVDSLIWDYLSATQPELTRGVKVVARYGPYASPPVVAAPHLPKEMRQQIQALLLSLHQSDTGQKILQGMHIERFERIDDSAYDSIRQLKTSCDLGRP